MDKSEEFNKIIDDFTRDLCVSYPELEQQFKVIDYNEYYLFCKEKYPENFFNILYENEELFEDEYRLHFRALSPEQINRYLRLEKPFDCAGAIKSEGLGVTLINRYEGNDPSSLIGLPLVKLSQALEKIGFDLLKNYPGE